ncbi:GNAT family N-acetyltransferase [Microlunatus soli]|uniref:GNAT family N-acetyltransferase n=1 Tax=Microlunatus soli TaxID=630515 RepID=UPI0018D2A16A|nr:GNAT family N-acetyltransferase [Microlunatus soli]
MTSAGIPCGACLRQPPRPGPGYATERSSRSVSWTALTYFAWPSTPDLRDDDDLARQILTDLNTPERGLLAAGEATIEARGAQQLRRVLLQHGWQDSDTWTPFSRSLRDPPEHVGVRVDEMGADRAEDWVAVHSSAFRGTQLTEPDRSRLVQKWLTMVTGPVYSRGCSLAAFDEQGVTVAVTTVWSAGPHRPGLIEPMGVHRDHRGQGYGRAITLAAAAALHRMGSSSAIVCAESSNAGALATYASAGFEAGKPVPDLCRNA